MDPEEDGPEIRETVSFRDVRCVNTQEKAVLITEAILSFLAGWLELSDISANRT
jgi:hypothetical protein